MGAIVVVVTHLIPKFTSLLLKFEENLSADSRRVPCGSPIMPLEMTEK